MDGIEVIETEWGSELHRELIALEAKARVEWRNSPEAREEMRRLREAPPLEWQGITTPARAARKTPIYHW